MKQLIKKIFQLKKTVTGNLAVGDVQRTIITSFGIPVLERRRVLLGVAPISSITGGGGGNRRSANHPHGVAVL